MKKQNSINDKKNYMIVYLTSGQALVFENSNQVPEEQIKFKAGQSNTKELKRIVKRCNKFFIAKWSEWIVELTKDEFLIVTGLKNKTNKIRR